MIKNKTEYKYIYCTNMKYLSSLELTTKKILFNRRTLRVLHYLLYLK